ncbi:MAG TPA: hypothetical protein VIV11_12215 [Kofleriaceae bacterium]
MRLPILFALTSLAVAACGDDGGSTTPDASVDIGFNTPTVTLKANMEIGEDQWMEIGPADLTCLNTPSADLATSVAVTLNAVVKDFQSGNAVPNSMVEIFPEQKHTMPFGAAVMADANANLTLTIPTGTKRFGYKMTASTALPTFLLNQVVKPDVMVQPEGTCNPAPCRTSIQSVSNATAATLPALIGQTRTVGTGVVAGALRDCQEREISGFIATMSSTPAMPNTIAGADTYYFDSEVGLPVHHNRQAAGSEDGLFMIIEVPGTSPTGYVQMWGFPTDADLAMGKAGLKLIAELQVPILADTVITGSYEPLRQ